MCLSACAQVTSYSTVVAAVVIFGVCSYVLSAPILEQSYVQIHSLPPCGAHWLPPCPRTGSLPLYGLKLLSGECTKSEAVDSEPLQHLEP